MLRAADLAQGCDHEVGCITCSDAAVELQVIEHDSPRGLALCADATGRKQVVETALVGPLERGEIVLVHAGTAIHRVAG